MTFLGRATLEGEGRSLIIAEGPALKSLPDRVLVTVEPIDHRAGTAPEGAAGRRLADPMIR